MATKELDGPTSLDWKTWVSDKKLSRADSHSFVSKKKYSSSESKDFMWGSFFEQTTIFNWKLYNFYCKPPVQNSMFLSGPSPSSFSFHAKTIG